MGCTYNLELYISLKSWPNAEVPRFESTVSCFYKAMSDLALRVLTVMAIGLQMVSLCN